MPIERSIEIAGELESESLKVSLKQEIADRYFSAYEAFLTWFLSRARSQASMELFLRNIRPHSISDSQWQLVEVLRKSAIAGWQNAGAEIAILLDDDSPEGGISHTELQERLYQTLCPSWRSGKVLTEATEVASFLDETRSEPSAEAFAVIQLHEAVSLAQFEFFTPLFRKYLRDNLGLSGKELKKALGWCLAHLGETERRHTRHASRAVEHWCKAEAISSEEFTKTQREKSSEYFKLHMAQIKSLESKLNG